MDAATGIIGHMNADHAAALRLIARHYSGEVTDEAAMTAVDRLGFHLWLKSADRVYGRRVVFLREVRSSEDTRSVLVETVRLARAAGSDFVTPACTPASVLVHLALNVTSIWVSLWTP